MAKERTNGLRAGVAALIAGFAVSQGALAAEPGINAETVASDDRRAGPSTFPRSRRNRGVQADSRGGAEHLLVAERRKRCSEPQGSAVSAFSPASTQRSRARSTRSPNRPASISSESRSSIRRTETGSSRDVSTDLVHSVGAVFRPPRRRPRERRTARAIDQLPASLRRQ